MAEWTVAICKVIRLMVASSANAHVNLKTTNLTVAHVVGPDRPHESPLVPLFTKTLVTPAM
jgi:hypothetical protein